MKGARQITSANELLRHYALGERDFFGAILDGVNLNEAILDGANLRGAYLSGADLSGASLKEATLERADLRNASLSGANLTGTRLRGASLHAANLHGANLSGADLCRANLCEADLRSARLNSADLSRTDLSQAQLCQAQLIRASLRGADLSGADLSGASLEEADLGSANLSGANFGEASLDSTSLVDVNLAAVCWSTISHEAASTVDHRSLLRSFREPNLAQFLRDAGMPEVFIQYGIECAKSLSPDVVFSLLQSTFISYGEPDRVFAAQLNEALKKEGVTTFFFKDDAVPGDELHSMMRRGVNEHDRVILVCSEASLTRKGLLNEIKETLRRESRDGGRSYLIPVVLDDYLFEGWKPSDPNLDVRAVTDRVAADFRNPDEFKAGIAKLVKALKKPEASRSAER